MLICDRLTGKEKCVGGFDLIWDDGPVYADSAFIESGSSLSSSAQLNSFLGLCFETFQCNYSNWSILLLFNFNES